MDSKLKLYFDKPGFQRICNVIIISIALPRFSPPNPKLIQHIVFGATSISDGIIDQQSFFWFTEVVLYLVLWKKF